MPTASLQERYEAAARQLEAIGQQQVLRWWDGLDDGQRETLLTQIEPIDWANVDALVKNLVLQKPIVDLPHNLEPAPIFPRRPKPGNESMYDEARELGRKILHEGKVGALTVAGGQGSRLGYDGPKGAVKVTPVGERTLFGIFAESLLAAGQRYGVDIPWYIMTSPANHQATIKVFAEHSHFGLQQDQIRFFSQGMLPAFNMKGKALLAEKGSMALAPDGHGGTLKALVESGSLADLQQRGIQIISYWQVDNPLIMPFDPLFIGLHRKTGSEMSSKVTAKVHDEEKVGNVCIADGRTMVIEYSDFPAEHARAKNEDGSRKFDAGSLAIHLFEVSFIDRIVGHTFSLPYRRAEKKVAFVDEHGVRQEPDTPNAVKLETFIFDAKPMAENPLVFEIDRREEFSPVKNATGVDSLESSMRHQNLRACRWLEAAGVTVPKKADGSPNVTVTILPSYALEPDDVKAKSPDELPNLEPGAVVLLK